MGTVYSVNSDGAVSVLYSFGDGADASQPIAGLIDVNGVLYGTTQSGGFDDGAVYSVTTSGAETVLYRFQANGSDGFEPWAPLIAVRGALYGTTIYGGSTASQRSPWLRRFVSQSPPKRCAMRWERFKTRPPSPGVGLRGSTL